MNDLEAAGIGVIQVDEPAIREGLPLRRADFGCAPEADNFSPYTTWRAARAIRRQAASTIRIADRNMPPRTIATGSQPRAWSGRWGGAATLMTTRWPRAS